MFRAEAPIEEIAVVKKDGKLYVDAFDGTGENVVNAHEATSESGRARKLHNINTVLYLHMLISFYPACSHVTVMSLKGQYHQFLASL